MYKSNPFLFARVLLYDEVSDKRKEIAKRQIKKELDSFVLGLKLNTFNIRQKQEIMLFLSQSEDIFEFLNLGEYANDAVDQVEKSINNSIVN